MDINSNKFDIGSMVKIECLANTKCSIHQMQNTIKPTFFVEKSENGQCSILTFDIASNNNISLQQQIIPMFHWKSNTLCLNPQHILKLNHNGLLISCGNPSSGTKLLRFDRKYHGGYIFNENITNLMSQGFNTITVIEQYNKSKKNLIIHGWYREFIEEYNLNPSTYHIPHYLMKIIIVYYTILCVMIVDDIDPYQYRTLYVD